MNGKAPQTTRQVGDLAMPVLNIQGKAYAPVNVRVEAAHHAGGFTMVRCEWKEIFGIKCCEVEIEREGCHFIGTAEIKPGFSFSIEDMQTSALGRALGFAGFEIKTAIASADDMEAVLKGQGRGTVVESGPSALPDPWEPARQLAKQLHYTANQWKAITVSEKEPERALRFLQEQARSLLNKRAAEQEAEEDAHLIPDEQLETALVHLHDELRRFPAD